MQDSRRTLLPVAALLFGVVVLVGGCGNDQSSAQDGDSTGATAGSSHGNERGGDGRPTEPRGAAGEHRPGGPGSDGAGQHAGGQGAERSGGGMPPFGGAENAAAVPVETARVMRRAISSYIETNGTLEAEYEVDLVARAAGPVVALEVEEGDFVKKDAMLARLDARELRAQLEISRVGLNEATLAHERALRLKNDSLISNESFDQIGSALDTARAQHNAAQIQLDYTEIRAPFDGLIIVRYVDVAEHVAGGQALFRLSDFTPLLCPIQVPERELRRLRKGQNAHLNVEAFPGERFEASVLRISPVVNATTGTIKVTLEVVARDLLRPGMFARVFLETDRRDNALVIPKSALSLESIGDTVYVADGDTASRREVTLGYTEGDFVEVLSGVVENDPVVVVGQDGLSDGTPIRVLAAVRRGRTGAPESTPQAEPGPASGGRDDVAQDDASGTSRTGNDRQQAGDPAAGNAGGQGFPPGRGRIDISKATPEQLERIKKVMRSRGLTEEQIEDRLKQTRQRPASPTQ